MKKIIALLIISIIISCSSDNDELIKQATIKLKFTQNWDGTEIEKSDLNSVEFENKLSTKLTIKRLRYLISKVTLVDASGNITQFNEYKLIDISDDENLTLTLPEKISEGTYQLFFTFGFNDDDNTDGIYTDLNTASWNVPEMLGGGYHFMQMDGEFTDNNGSKQPYNFHIIRAYNSETATAEDTSFIVNLGVVSITNNATVEVKMNVAEWFKNPNDWDLNDKSIDLMMDYDAQKLMFENGQRGVFSLGKITQ